MSENGSARIGYGKFHYQKPFPMISTAPSLALASVLRPVPRSFDHLTALVLDSLNCPATKHAYKKAFLDFLNCHASEPETPFTRATVHAYRAWLMEKHSQNALEKNLADRHQGDTS